MRVLVTGGAGFIGSHVVKLLMEKGHEVIVLDNLSTGSLSVLEEGVQTIIANIIDENIVKQISIQKVDAIIHLAAQTSGTISSQQPIVDMRSNIEGTLNMLLLARKLQVKSFVFASTADVYGDTSIPTKESSPLHPTTPYGISKQTAEIYTKYFCGKYKIKYAILRYASVYGPMIQGHGKGGVINTFCEQLLKNEQPTIYGDGNQTRDFVHVSDIAEATVMSLGTENAVCNVGSSQQVRVNQIYRFIKEILGSQINPKYVNRRDGDIKHSCLDHRQIMETIGWKPSINLVKGIKMLIEDLKIK
jgi:UDP-glucose 4-epimerase